MNCNHSHPELCQLLGKHIAGRLMELWNDSRKYRAAWCERAGVDLAEMEDRFPPERDTNAIPTKTTKSIIRKTQRSKKTKAGVGTNLKKFLKEKYGISTSGNCECNRHAAEMDSKGVEWCEQNIETIIGWLKEGAASRYWLSPIVKLFPGSMEKRARSLVQEAIELSKTKTTPIKWQVGITTVPSRVSTLLPKTLDSMANGGFNEVYLFVDGRIDGLSFSSCKILGVTERDAPLGIVGNWMTALWDLYVREPLANRYALFQDDFVMCRNVKPYLDKLTLPEDGYWNLFSFMNDNEKLLEASNVQKGFIKSSQYGRGAIALVFPRSAVVNLLSSRTLAMKPQSAQKRVANKKIDGGICTALCPVHKQAASHTEYIHNPSLVQHMGDVSTLGNHNQPKAKTFPGEEFDCLSLLEIKSDV